MPKLYRILLLIILLPLLFINVRNSHDWGDDFAQYLIQAKNIVESEPQIKNGLQFDAEAGRFAVQAYPVGFPLLLSPVVAVSGIQIKPLLIFESALLIGLAFLCFTYFRKFFKAGIAILMTVFLAYHSFTLNLKSEILSEIPFTVLLMLILLQLRPQSKSNAQWMILGLCCGLLASVRITGLLILPALGCSLIYNHITDTRKEANRFFSLKIFTLILFSALASFLILNSWLFKIPIISFFDFYSQAAIENKVSFAMNIKSYIDQLGSIFKITFLSFGWWGALAGFFTLTGFLRSFIRKNKAEDWFFLFYILLLGIYPYTSGGFRFIFPVFPFLLLYFLDGINSVALVITKNLDQKIHFPVLLLLLAAQALPFYHSLSSKELQVVGPQSEESVEMFSYIKTNTPEDAIIIFPRARVMSLYGERKSTYLLQKNSPEENISLFRKLNARYLVLPKQKDEGPLFDPALWKYLDANRMNLRQTWQNHGFELYEASNF